MARWVVIAILVLVPVDIWLYMHASEPARNDIRAIAVVGAFMLSAVGALHGSTWLLDRLGLEPHPALLAGALVVALGAFVWACFALYVVLRVLVNSVT